MSMAEQATTNGDGWTWWQSRRLGYNLALAAVGWTAYGLFVGELYAFGKSPWESWQGGVAMTLFLGIAYLLFMGAANVCFLLGPWTETWAAPADRPNYRKIAWRMGFWGSLAVPFAFPGVNLAMLIGQSGAHPL